MSPEITCEYPGCSDVARYLNDGGFWCHHPHAASEVAA